MLKRSTVRCILSVTEPDWSLVLVGGLSLQCTQFAFAQTLPGEHQMRVRSFRGRCWWPADLVGLPFRPVPSAVRRSTVGDVIVQRANAVWAMTGNTRLILDYSADCSCAFSSRIRIISRS